ncbi:dynactin subunit 1-like, partial [Saccoglossus kowalevskii]
LGENVSLDNVVKAIQYYQHLFNVHLVNEDVDCTAIMSDFVRQLTVASEGVNVNVKKLKVLMQPGQEMSDFSILLKDVDSNNTDLRQLARRVSLCLII